MPSEDPLDPVQISQQPILQADPQQWSADAAASDMSPCPQARDAGSATHLCADSSPPPGDWVDPPSLSKSRGVDRDRRIVRLAEARRKRGDRDKLRRLSAKLDRMEAQLESAISLVAKLAHELGCPLDVMADAEEPLTFRPKRDPGLR